MLEVGGEVGGREVQKTVVPRGQVEGRPRDHIDKQSSQAERRKEDEKERTVTFWTLSFNCILSIRQDAFTLKT